MLKQPTISELTAQVVTKMEDAEMVASALDELGQVEPHEMTVGLRTDPRTAWTQSIEALGTAVDQLKVTAPSDWGRLIVRQNAVAALPFAIGNYPQRVRELGTLIQTNDLSKLLEQSKQDSDVSKNLGQWCEKHIESGKMPQAMIAAALYRVSGDLETASRTLEVLVKTAPFEWTTTLENERAALLWETGRHAQARAMWESLPDTNPVMFNRGMAALFMGDAKSAIAQLRKLVSQLPESSAWHHLASVYLALAEMRGA